MKKNKKILFLINNLSFFLSHRLPIAEALFAKGFDIFIGYGELRGADPKLLEQKGFNVNFVPMKPGSISLLSELKTFFLIWKLFRKIKPNIVHLVTIRPYLYGGIVSRLTGIKCLVSAVSGLGTLFIHNNLKSRFLRLLLYPIYRLAFNHSNQKIILQNNEDKKLLVNWGVLHKSKIQLINGSGVRLENFLNLDEPNGIPLISFAGRLLKDKGVYDFVSAARLFKERGIKAQFYLIGDLDVNNPSSLNIKDLKMIIQEGYVKVLGYQKDIPSLYAKSNIICLPSYREGFPKALIEAAAASRAVVTTDVPGCRDAIIPNETGLLVPVKNPQKLANALQWLIENPNKRIAMGKAGRKLAEKEFQIQKIVQGHFDIYQELLSKELN
jgi:glycosyltransferase involved in cell wall biosynthesis